MLYLKPGDKVALIAPSYALASGAEEETLEKASTLLRNWGYEAVPYYDPSREHKFAGMRFEGTTQQRAETLYTALSNPDIKAVMALRGGYGAVEVVLEIYNNPDKYPPLPAQQAKPVVGFSDITAMHLLLNQVWGWPSIHGEVITRLVKENPDATTLAKTEAALKGDFADTYSLAPLNEAASSCSEISAPITGGNMVVLQYLMGTALEVNFRDKTLLLEDIGEPARKIDGRLRQLAELYTVGVDGTQEKVMDAAKAIVFGDFVGDTEADELAAEEIINAFASNVNVPVYRLAGVGHGNVNLPLIFGLPVTISDSLLHLSQSHVEPSRVEEGSYVSSLSAEELSQRAR